MSKTVQTALKQLRQAASNLYIESTDHSASDESRDFMRAARHTVETLANAIEYGSTYKITGHAQGTDNANENREAQLHQM